MKFLNDAVVKEIVSKSNFSKNPTQEDKQNLLNLCKRFFNEDGTVSIHTKYAIEEFAAIVVQLVDKDMQTTLNESLSRCADIVQGNGLDYLDYSIEPEYVGSTIQIANGGFVDTVRASSNQKQFATPKLMAGGVHFDIKAFYRDADTATEKLKQDIFKDKQRQYMRNFYNMTSAAVTSGKIPAKNVLNKTGSTIAEFRKVSNTVGRNQSTDTLFIADTLLIDYYAGLEATATNMSSDATKDDYRHMRTVNIGNATCLPITNPWTDQTNTNVQYPVNIGILINGGTAKPFKIFEFGGTFTETTYDDISGRVNVMIKWKNDMQLLYGNRIGYVKEGSVSI